MHDIRGFLTEEEFGEHFLSPPFDIREITADELRATRPVHDFVIARGRKLAETLWPDLPWIETAASRAIVFADELETLCRKHGLWIFNNIPTQLPLLVQSDGEEGGYEVIQRMDGGFAINRYFQVDK